MNVRQSTSSSTFRFFKHAWRLQQVAAPRREIRQYQLSLDIVSRKSFIFAPSFGFGILSMAD